MDPLIGVAVTVLATLVATYVTARTSNRKLRADSSLQMIDQYQEDAVEQRTRITALERAVRVQSDYIGLLRRHIADAQPPPPPPYPRDLVS